jgi:basic membrane protein A and related proteins
VHKRSWLRILAVLLGLALVAAACGDDDTTESGDDGTEDTTDGDATTDGEGDDGEGDDGTTDDAAGEGMRIGLVYDIGGRGDQSFNDAAFAGLSQAEEELGVEVRDLEPAGTGEDREELLRTLADEGFDMIIGVGFAFEEAIGAAAADYSDITFGIVDMVVEADNVTSLVFAEEQGSFLVGAAAALTSETGQIGFIGGVEIDLIQKFEAGYVAGAEAADPDVEVAVQYISQPPDFAGFNDPARGREIASGQFGGGADVIYHAAGGSGGGLFEAALETSEEGDQVWAIGVDSDQYNTAEEEVRDHILTSMLKRVDVAVFDAIDSFVNGELEGGVRVYDLSNDGVGYSTSGDFLSDDVISELDDLRQQIVDGEIEVPTTP